jgi:tetratricopeptide (TPR) repeat protein
MSKKAKQQDADKSFEGIEQALTKTEQFVEDNSKVLSYVILSIIVAVLIVMGAKRYYINPMEEEASGQMFIAEKFFERDSFDLALNGYGTYPGFLEIIEDYGLTKASNLASYYAGVSYLHLGDFENAIEQLEDFKTKDLLLGSAKYSSLGDAYAEMGEYDSAVKAYTKGLDKFKNDFSSPLILKKLGIIYEEKGEYKKAADSYRQIRNEYSDTPEGRDIEKYIARAELKING